MILPKRLLVVVLPGLLLAGPEAGAQQPQPDQTQRLAALCEVWGLLKYFHPQVASRTDWDDALIAAVPKFKAAATRQAFNEEVVALVRNAGRELPTGIPRDAAPLGATFRWIDDPSLFEPETSLLLKAIALGKQPGWNYYVQAAAGVGNPVFSNERVYDTVQYPGEEIRLLAAFRFWNMVHYFFRLLSKAREEAGFFTGPREPRGWSPSRNAERSSA
jgi:carboxyl-terminal processing protease